MAGAPSPNAPPAAPAQTAPGGVQRGNLDDNASFGDFQDAKEKIKQAAEAKEAEATKAQNIKAKADVIADEKLSQFDIDAYLKEIESDAVSMEKELDLASKLQFIRENGLSEEQQTKMTEIKKIVADRKGNAVAGTPNVDPAQPPAQTTAQTVVQTAAQTVVQPAAQTVVQPAAQPAAQTVTMPVGDPAQPAAAGGTVAPPVVDSAAPAAAPAQTMPTAEDITKIVQTQLNTYKEETDKKLADLVAENTTLKEQVETHTQDKKEVIEQRDKLKDEKRITEFSDAAATAGVAKDLRVSAYGVAQQIVNNAKLNPDKKALTYEEVFVHMRESHPSFFGTTAKPGENSTQIKPGASGTGTSAGGAMPPKQDPTKKKAETWNDARENLQNRVNLEST